MDPTTMIVAALVAGLTSGMTDMGKQAILDIYTALKARIDKKVAGKEDAQNALSAIEKRPSSEPRKAVLIEELAALKADQDSELLALAKALLEKLDEEGSKSGKYNVVIQNTQGVVIGDQPKVTQRFVNKPNEDRS